MTQTAAQIDGSRELEALREAVSQHHEFVYRLAFRFLKNHADAEDLTQGVFLRALRAIDMFRRVENRRAWLARVTVHLSVSWHRAAGRRRRHERVWAESRILEKKGSPDMADEAIEKAIAALPSELRVPLVLHYREGLKYREIADVCGCSEGMVARRLHLAKGWLRRRLGRNSAGEPGRENGPEKNRGKNREKNLGGAALLGAGGFEATLRAEAPVEVPPGLEGRLCESIERELAVAARTAARASSTAKSAWVGLKTALVSGPVVSLCIATLVTGSIWLGLGIGRRVRPPSEPESGLAVARAAGPSIAPQRPQPHGKVAGLVPAPAQDAVPADGDPAAIAEDAAPPQGSTTFFGWVRDPHGKPVAGAKVSLADSTLVATFGSAVSDAEGYYELKGPGPGCASTQTSGEARLGQCSQCHSGGAVRPKIGSWKDFSFTGTGGGVAVSSGMDLLYEPYSEVKVQRANVELVLRSEEIATRFLTESITLAGAAIAAEAKAELYTRELAWADWAETGLARASKDPGRLRLCAHRENFQAAASDELDVELGGRTRQDFVLPEAAGISGQVLSENGEPLSGATVEIAAHGGDLLVPAAVLATRAGEDGAFKLDSIPDGLYAVRIWSPGFLPLDAVFSTGESGVQLVLARSGGVRVQVAQRGTGEPLGGYRVELRAGGISVASATTGSDGQAVFETLWPGEYLVNTFRDDSKSRYSRGRTRVRVESGVESGVAIEISARARLRGWVLGPPEASPERGVTVFAAPMDGMRRVGGEVKSCAVKEDGSFEITSLVPGPYLVAAYRTAKSGGQEPAAACELEIAEGQTEAFAEVRLDPGQRTRLGILVLDDRGRPVAGARTSIERLHVEKTDAERTTSVEGRAEIETVAGTFRLKVRAPGFATAFVDSLILESDAASDQVVRLGPADGAADGSGDVTADFSLSSRGPISLRGLAEMIRRSGGKEIAFDPTLEAAGVPDRISHDNRRVARAEELFEAALQAQNLVWESFEGRNWVFPAR